MAGADVNNFTASGPEGKRLAAGGWYHFFHMDDIRTIAPRWLHYEVLYRFIYIYIYIFTYIYMRLCFTAYA